MHARISPRSTRDEAARQYARRETFSARVLSDDRVAIQQARMRFVPQPATSREARLLIISDDGPVDDDAFHIAYATDSWSASRTSGRFRSTAPHPEMAQTNQNEDRGQRDRGAQLRKQFAMACVKG